MRKGSAYPGRAGDSLVRGAIAVVGRADPRGRPIHVRADSAFCNRAFMAACIDAGATFTVTAKWRPNVRAAIYRAATSTDTLWAETIDMDGSQVCSVPFSFSDLDGVRLIVRRSPRRLGTQLAFDDLDGYSFQAIMTNDSRSDTEVEHHHRLRGGVCEETMRQLKEGFGLAHLPVGRFFGNWVWALLACLAHNVATWTRVLGLPRDQRRMRVKRFRRLWLNVAARVVRTARRIVLRLASDHPDPDAFMAAYERLRLLPAFP
jgi:hypothetical protein